MGNMTSVHLLHFASALDPSGLVLRAGTPSEAFRFRFENVLSPPETATEDPKRLIAPVTVANAFNVFTIEGRGSPTLVIESRPLGIPATALLSAKGSRLWKVLFPSQQGLTPEQSRCFINGTHTFFMRLLPVAAPPVPPPVVSGTTSPKLGLSTVLSGSRMQMVTDSSLVQSVTIHPWMQAGTALLATTLNKKLTLSAASGNLDDKSKTFGLGTLDVTDIGTKEMKWYVQGIVAAAAPASQSTTFHARLWTLSHPHIATLIDRVRREGVAGLFTDEVQNLRDDFVSMYSPDSLRVQQPYPDLGIDFSANGPCADWNRELWIYLRMLFSDRLMEQGDVKASQDVLSSVFDWRTPGLPTDIDRFWKVRVLREAKPLRMDELLKSLQPGKQGTPEQEEVLALVNDLIKYPFEPFRLAERRPVFLKQAIFLKHADLLQTMCDNHFRQGNLSAAFQVCGTLSSMFRDRPQRVPSLRTPAPQTFAQLRSKLNAAGNAMIEAETEWPVLGTQSRGTVSENVTALVGTALTSYFCLPTNTKLTAYYDYIDDRLYKLRNGLDIDGNPRPQTLYDELPDPARILNMAASGANTPAMASASKTAAPRLRFLQAIQKALEVCDYYIGLEQMRLAANEKVDELHYATKRAEFETALQQMAQAALKDRIKAQQARIDSLSAQRRQVQHRIQYYSQRLNESMEAFTDEPDDNTNPSKAVQPQPITGKRTRALSLSDKLDVPSLPDIVGIGLIDDAIQKAGDEIFGRESATGFVMLAEEMEEMKQAFWASVFSQGAGMLDALASPIHILPNISVNIQPMGCGASATMGGSNIAASFSALAGVLRGMSGSHGYLSSRAAKLAAFVWREHGDIFNRLDSVDEMEKLDWTLLSEKRTLAGLDKEKDNLTTHIEKLMAFETLIRERIVNLPLAEWRAKTLDRLSEELWNKHVLYWANLAQQALRFYLGKHDVTYVTVGSTSETRKKCVDGQVLKLQLLNMQKAWNERPREFASTAHISLRQLNPAALVTLQQTGQCEFAVPELFYDMISPGHYFRRIEQVSVTIPCILGPHATLNGMLRLKSHQYRIKPTSEDDSLVSDVVPIQSIVVSRGQNDTGESELSPKEELHPFEGAGAIATFQLEFPNPVKGFPPCDYQTFQDVVLNIQLRSLYDGALKVTMVKKTQETLKAMTDLSPFGRLFTLRHEFANEWARYTTPAGGTTIFVIPKSHYSFMFQGKRIVTMGIEVYCRLKTGAAPLEASTLTMATPNGAVTLQKGKVIPGFHIYSGKLDSIEIVHDPQKSSWGIDLPLADRQKLDDISLIFAYTIG